MWYMALINIAAQEIHCKIVYYGIGYCGKTTNLDYVFKSIDPRARGEMFKIATETERTLFFDFLPLDLGSVHGFRTRFHLYTVPGQILYERTRQAVLNGVDGIVFVVDSQAEKFEENVQSITELEMNLRRLGKDMNSFPFVIQWNKRDMPSALPLPVLERYLNRRRVPSFEAIAANGKGVYATLRSISKRVMQSL
jgi:mutual gliding-motility protein MglA